MYDPQCNIQHSILKLFVTGFEYFFKVVFRTLPNIYGGAFCENRYRLKAINYFYKRDL